ncbi:HipA domain-containing protein [Psychroflexus maritimus]|uniref:HipA domain-containing protein n=1 Tax=Psychroflexus maritimus TaxID=2714865 RepID=A0A967AER8_9FLAO|nr:HipA domain-containing protein [Psychroflexus maritimus]NGZ90218.1 HipA domain-containing protein [Psychroflexus maritimus]
MKGKCLYCYGETTGGKDFHDKCSMAFFGSTTPPTIDNSLSQMDELAKNVVERSVAVPGVQPKLSMSLIKETLEKTDSRLTVIGALGGEFILKPPSELYPEMPENEHVTMKIAEHLGIKTVPSSLIRLASGELSYITKRIDRTHDGKKVHMLDMFQIMEAFDKYKSSMEKIGKAIDLYSSNTLLDKVLYFELVVFSFITGNNDMHLKNFSLIKGPVGWTLSPAYDLLNASIANPDDDEELALTLNGKKRKLRSDDFVALGKGMGLSSKQIKGAFKRTVDNLPVIKEWIDKSFLSADMKEKYKAIISSRTKAIGL